MNRRAAEAWSAAQYRENETAYRRCHFRSKCTLDPECELYDVCAEVGTTIGEATGRLT